jgi:hypothetical protein
MHTIYTWGYTGASTDDIKDYTTSLGALVVDIRFSPHSRVLRWTSEALRALLGSRNYTWVKALGNENYNRPGPVRLHHPQVTIAGMGHTLRQRPVILLCACADWHICHRAEAANYLADALGVKVEHLPGKYSEWVDELARAAFGDYHGVELPSGAVAHVSPDASPETLAALDRMAVAAMKQYGGLEDSDAPDNR